MTKTCNTKKQKFQQQIKIVVKNGNFSEKSKFWHTNKILAKIKSLAKVKFEQKLKFLQIINIFRVKSNFW